MGQDKGVGYKVMVSSAEQHLAQCRAEWQRPEDPANHNQGYLPLQDWMSLGLLSYKPSQIASNLWDD